MLIGEPLHRLHGGDRTTAIRRDAGPRVAADVLQTGNRFCTLCGAGIHTGLPLAGLAAVGPAGKTEALVVANGTIVVVLLAGRTFQVWLLIAVFA